LPLIGVIRRPRIASKHTLRTVRSVHLPENQPNYRYVKGGSQDTAKAMATTMTSSRTLVA
jgi:hypothetical protein